MHFPAKYRFYRKVLSVQEKLDELYKEYEKRIEEKRGDFEMIIAEMKELILNNPSTWIEQNFNIMALIWKPIIDKIFEY